jgi:hypothetical protein
MNIAKIERDFDAIYMLQDISGLQGYDRAKAIVNFCDKETKIFEREIDRAILEILSRNGINVPNTDKSVLKLAFDLLKAKKKNIVVINTTESAYKCELIKQSKLFNVYLEDDRYLQVSVRVREIEL